MIPGQAQQFFEAAAAQAGGGDHQIERSLRFNEDDTANLSRTFSTFTDLNVGTISFWLKRSGLGAGVIAAGWDGGVSYSGSIQFNSSDNALQVSIGGAAAYTFKTNAILRDTNAWYHVVAAWDRGAAAADKVKVWINGVAQTSSTTAYQSWTSGDCQIWASNSGNRIGRGDADRYGNFLNGYLAEYHYVDGQALDESSFGQFDTNNNWNPKAYSGSYGSNGFYLKFADNSSDSALGTDSSGNGNNWTVNNINAADGAAVTVGAANGGLPIRNTSGDQGGTPVSGFRSDSSSSQLFLALPLNTNTSDVSNSINSGSTTKTTTNQSTATSSTQARFYGASSYWNANTDGILVAESGSELVVGTGDFTIELWFYDDSNHGGGGSGRCYLFDNRIGGSIVGDPPTITGYVDGSSDIKYGSSGGGTITSSQGTDGVNNKWFHFAAVRNSGTTTLYINGTSVGSHSDTTNYTNNGFGIGRATDGGYGWAGYIQDFRVYKTAKYTSDFNIPAEANPTIGADCDSLIDSPTSYTAESGNNGGNYALLNPLSIIQSVSGDTSTPTFSNGNLTYDGVSSKWGPGFGSIAIPSSGKWYFEATLASTTVNAVVGIAKYLYATGNRFWDQGTGTQTLFKSAGGGITHNSTSLASGTSLSASDVVGVAINCDDGEAKFYLNGALEATVDIPANVVAAIDDGEAFPFVDSYNGVDWYLNFGSRPFAFTPPTDHVSLCTQNLSDPSIPKSSTAFDTKLWTGNGTARSITGYDFSPDFAWIKDRTGTDYHSFIDIVRGGTKVVFSNVTNAEETQSQAITSFNSDGFDLGTWQAVNKNSGSFVGWTWDAGTSNTSLSVGDLNSSAYNTSQTWSSNVSGGSGAYGAAANAFNGSLSNFASPEYSSPMTYTNPSASDTVISTFELYLDIYTMSGITLELNDTDITSQVSTTKKWYSISGFSGDNFSKLYWRPTSGNFEVRIYAIRINGQILLDNGVTPPNVPTVASTYRANPTAGTSIVTWTGAANATVGHGLNAAPELVWTKSRTSAVSWRIWSAAFPNAAANYLGFDNSGMGTFAGTYWGDMNSQTIGLGDGTYDNNTGDMVAFCFAPVESYSAFGSFEGSGNADGPFIYTGFRPRFILMKNIDNAGSGYDWFTFDTARDTYNVSEKILLANTNGAESNSDTVDILSNGFKIRTTANGVNLNAHTIIYAAFAEHPFKTARAR